MAVTSNKVDTTAASTRSMFVSHRFSSSANTFLFHDGYFLLPAASSPTHTPSIQSRIGVDGMIKYQWRHSDVSSCGYLSLVYTILEPAVTKGDATIFQPLAVAFCFVFLCLCVCLGTNRSLLLARLKYLLSLKIEECHLTGLVKVRFSFRTSAQRLHLTQMIFIVLCKSLHNS